MPNGEKPVSSSEIGMHTEGKFVQENDSFGETQVLLPLESLVGDKRAREALLDRFKGNEETAYRAVIEAVLNLWRRKAKLSISLDGDPRLNSDYDKRKIAVAGVKIRPLRFNNAALAQESARGAIEGAQALARKYDFPLAEIVQGVISQG